MRREKDVRDHREALRRKAAALREHKRRKARNKMRGDYNKRINRARKVEEKARQVGVVANKEFPMAPFKTFDGYACARESPIRVCHLIDSLGMGGGQTMMMELVGALNRYYKGKVENTIVCPRTNPSKWDKTFYQSYGLEPIAMRDKDLAKFLKKNSFDIVLHHRLAVSKCLFQHVPKNVRYILLNHTYHQLARIGSFVKCDLYISVCQYLHKNTSWPSYVHPSRRIVILNGVENDYLADLPTADLKGTFKTGRCHRMVQTKFKVDSLTWLEKKVSKHIKGLSHYLIGHSPEAKRTCKKMTACNYVGAVNKRGKKMSIIKGLDLYFYETFQNEGASVAVLESLACIPKSQKLFVNGRLQAASDVRVGDVIYGGHVLKTFDNGVAEIINIKTVGLPPFRATPDHRVRIYDVQSGESWKNACDLSSGDYLIFPKYKFVSSSIIDLTEYRRRRKCKVDITHLHITSDLAYLLGWYLAEGDSSSNGVVTFSLSGLESHVAQELARICRTELKLQFHEKKTPGQSGIRWYFCHAVLARWFRNNFGSSARLKRIPNIVLNLPADLLQRFLEGYAEGDGWYNPRKMKTVMSTASLELSYQLILAYSKLDQLAVWQKKVKTEHKSKICGREVTVHPSWIVSVVPHHAKSKKRYLQDDQNFYLPISSISAGEKEDVVNYTTSTSQYCAPFVITHNCGVPVICKNFGGNIELVVNGHNGFVVKTREDYLLRMKDLADNPEKLQAIKTRTLEDFNARLHVKHAAAKYMQVFEALL